MRRVRPIDIVTVLVLVTAVALAIADRTLLDERIAARGDAFVRERAISKHWAAAAHASTPAWFPSDTGLVVIEALQYSCGGCIAAAPEVRQATGKTSRLALLHLPPEHDSIATLGAALSICAATAGAGAAMHDFLTSTTDWRHQPPERTIANVVAPDIGPRVIRCVQQQHEWRAVLQEHRRLGHSLRIRYTPFFFGRSGSTAPSRSGLDSLIERESGADRT